MTHNTLVEQVAPKTILDWLRQLKALKAENDYLKTLVRQQAETIAELECRAENDYLKTLVRQQAETIAELECRVDPYSADGEAVCNSRWVKD